MNFAKLRQKGLIQHRSELFSRDDLAVIRKKFRSFTILKSHGRSRDPYVWTRKTQDLWTAARISRLLFEAVDKTGDLKLVIWRQLLALYRTELYTKLLDQGYELRDAERVAADAQLRISSENFQTEGREIMTS